MTTRREWRRLAAWREALNDPEPDRVAEAIDENRPENATSPPAGYTATSRPMTREELEEYRAASAARAPSLRAAMRAEVERQRSRLPPPDPDVEAWNRERIASVFGVPTEMLGTPPATTAPDGGDTNVLLEQAFAGLIGEVQRLTRPTAGDLGSVHVAYGGGGGGGVVAGGGGGGGAVGYGVVEGTYATGSGGGGASEPDAFRHLRRAREEHDIARARDAERRAMEGMEQPHRPARFDHGLLHALLRYHDTHDWGEVQTRWRYAPSGTQGMLDDVAQLVRAIHDDQRHRDLYYQRQADELRRRLTEAEAALRLHGAVVRVEAAAQPAADAPRAIRLPGDEEGAGHE